MIRTAIAAIVVALAIAKVLTGIFGIILLIFAFIFVMTSLFSFCPVYKLFGFSTNPNSGTGR